MPSIKGKTALVTGVSSGIGKATVELLIASRAKVHAVVRRVEKMKDLEKVGAKVVKLYVTDETSMLLIKPPLQQRKCIKMANYPVLWLLPR